MELQSCLLSALQEGQGLVIFLEETMQSEEEGGGCKVATLAWAWVGSANKCG